MNTKVIQEITFAQQQLLSRFTEAGLNEGLIKKIINSEGNELATEMVQLVRDENKKSHTSLKHACRIMGKNIFGFTEVEKYYGVTLTEEQVSTFEKIPWPKDVLKACKDTHILVLVLPLSILDLRHRVDYDFFAKHKNAKYNNKKFARNEGKAGWHLVCKTKVVNSLEKKLERQKRLLSEDEEIPSAQVIVYTIISHRIATGEVLFPQVYVRTSDTDGKNYCVAVGHHGNKKLTIDTTWGPDRKIKYIGLSSEKKKQQHA